MGQIISLPLDLLPAYAPFEKQATKADGTKINPSVAVVRVYEESGSDATFDNSEIAGSPFTCNTINAKVGNYGVLIDKSLFSAGKYYRLLWEWTVDGITTAEEDTYFFYNTVSYKANVSPLALEATLTAIKGAGWTDETLKAIKDAVDAITVENFNMSAEKA